MYGLLFAFLSPIAYAFANVFEKYIMMHRVRNTLGYPPIAAAGAIVVVSIVALFLDWSAVTPAMLLFPTIIGVIIGVNSYLYFFNLQKSDASHLIGLLYTYPLLVAGLSFVFLHERLTPLGYVGVGLTLFGVQLLSTRLRNFKRAALVLLGTYVVLVGVEEFLVKISTNSLPPLQGAVLSAYMFSATILLGLLSRRIRTAARAEVRNIGYAAVGNVINLSAFIMLFLAMAELPATVVSSIAAIQPLVVLGFEWVAVRHISNMVQDKNVLRKFVSLLLVVLGVVLMTASL